MGYQPLQGQDKPYHQLCHCPRWNQQHWWENRSEQLEGRNQFDTSHYGTNITAEHRTQRQNTSKNEGLCAGSILQHLEWTLILSLFWERHNNSITTPFLSRVQIHIYRSKHNEHYVGYQTQCYVQITINKLPQILPNTNLPSYLLERARLEATYRQTSAADTLKPPASVGQFIPIQKSSENKKGKITKVCPTEEINSAGHNRILFTMSIKGKLIENARWTSSKGKRPVN